MTKTKELLPMTPHVVSPIWGGTRLKELKNLQEFENIGETWEVSTLKNKCSTFENHPLLDLVGEIPYLIKFIDTNANLSIQVHPDDDYAKMHENSLGKTECWIILDSTNKSGIYLGLKKNVSKELLENGIKEKEDISKLLNFYETKRGDFFYVPSGSIHAIGNGVTLLEIQQSSGITYRVWDWNRVDKDGKERELHVKQALDVINFDPNLNSKSAFKHQTEVFKPPKNHIVDHKDFNVTVYNVSDSIDIELPIKHSSIICVSGKISVSREDETTDLNEYQTLFLPNTSNQHINIKSKNNSTFILVY